LEFQGYVRTISLHTGNRVQVAFDIEGHDEGGAYFWGTYPDLEHAIGALETFLCKPLSAWALPHLETAGARTRPDPDALANGIRAGSIPLPSGTEFVLQDPYWSQFLPRSLPGETPSP
jgi:hypothetical protein